MYIRPVSSASCSSLKHFNYKQFVHIAGLFTFYYGAVFLKIFLLYKLFGGKPFPLCNSNGKCVIYVTWARSYGFY
jgi:hypothetical protein